MPKIRIEPDAYINKTLNFSQVDVDKYVKSCLHDACELIRDYARVHHEYEDNPARQAREGHKGLTRAIKYRVLRRAKSEYGFVGEVYIDEKIAPYGRYQLYGTKDHGPVVAPALRFFSDRFGSWFSLKQVSGIKADNFLQKALDDNRLEVTEIFRRRWEEMMNGKL